MDRAHVIETLSFEVGFASEADAQALHSRYGDFAAGRALAVIREVFDEVSGPGEVLQLDTLEVDLGEIPPVWDEAEAEARLREALRRALDGRVRPAAMGGGGPAPWVDPAAAELELVWGHLHHGLLSWQAGQLSAPAFDALVLRVLAAQGPALARRLRASPAAPRLIARLARQWPHAAVTQLAGLLSAEAAGEGAPATDRALAAIPPRAEAWAARLLALAAGADPSARDATSEGAAEAAAEGAARRGADLAPALSAAAWPALIGGEPRAARARLRSAGRDAAWRGRLAGLLTPARRGQLLALWGPPADAAFIAAVLSEPQAWRLGTAQTAGAVEPALLAALVEHLLLSAGERLDVDAVIAALVTARGAAEGLAPVAVARALAANWAPAGPAADAGPRLRVALFTRFGIAESAVEAPPGPGSTAGGQATPAGADTPTPGPRWRLEPEPRPPGAPDVGDDVWRRRVRREPAGLAAQLRARGRTAAQRRGLARDLTPARLADLLSLWFDPADAAFVDAVTTAAEAWARAAPSGPQPADLALRLREWLLAALLLAPAQGRLTAEAVVASLLSRRADFEDLAPAAVARSLIDAWPADGPAAVHRARLRETLEALGTDPAGVPAADGPSPSQPDEAAPSPQRLAVRAALEQAFAARAPAPATEMLREALANDRPWLTATLASQAGDAALRAALVRDLPTALLFALVQPRLSEAAARLLLAAAPSPALGPDAERAFWDDVLAAVWARDGRGAGAPIAAGALWRPLLRGAGPQVRQARRQAARAARAYLRDTPAAAGASPVRAAPSLAGPSLAAWAERLPERPTAAVRRAATALLVPPAAGVVQLASVSPARRRPLIARLRPAEARGAFAALDALAAAAQAARLRQPPEGWAGFGERVLLRELFEEDRPFAAEGFATRWFEAWLARAADTDAVRARRALANALDVAAVARALPGPDSAPPAAPQAPADAAARSAPPQPSADDAASRDRQRPPADISDTVHPGGAEATPTPTVRPPAPGLAASQIVGAEPVASEAAAEAGPAEPRVAEPPDPRVLAEALRAEAAADLAADRGDEASGPAPEPEADRAIYVDNAGVVLAGPYIPMLFDRLRLTRAGRFVDDAAVERAIHLLQFMVDGEEVAAPEHRLALNKLLCGLDFRTPLSREFRIEDHERETIESLLKAMIERWSIIGRTSVAGLRESFFQRQGALTAEAEAWRLKVQPRAFDMLIDQIPWGFTTQRMPWMAQVLYVDWR